MLAPTPAPRFVSRRTASRRRRAVGGGTSGQRRRQNVKVRAKPASACVSFLAPRGQKFKGGRGYMCFGTVTPAQCGRPATPGGSGQTLCALLPVFGFSTTCTWNTGRPLRPRLSSSQPLCCTASVSPTPVPGQPHQHNPAVCPLFPRFWGRQVSLVSTKVHSPPLSQSTCVPS